MSCSLRGVDLQEGTAQRLEVLGDASGSARAISRTVRLIGQRGAQLVRGVGDEPALGVEGDVEPGQHVVEGVGQLLELVVGALEVDPLVGQGALGELAAVAVICATGRSARSATK